MKKRFYKPRVTLPEERAINIAVGKKFKKMPELIELFVSTM